MKQLTGLDGSFLYMETPTSFGHVNGLAHLRATERRLRPVRKRCTRRFASKVGELEPMRRRIVEVPMHLDHPYWIDDPDFDLDFHIRHMSLAPPGRVDQLAEQIARIVGRPMDRTRPLWEVYVIEGLESDRWALLTKYHHATIDGASGVLMMTLMNDLTPDAAAAGREPAVGAGRDPERPRAAAADDRQPDPQPGQGGARPAAHGARRRQRRRASRASARRPSQAGAAIKALTSRTDDRPRVSLPLTVGAADAVEQVASRPTAASPCATPCSATSSGSRTRPAARSTTS